MTRKIPTFHSLPWGVLHLITAIVWICSAAGFLGRYWWPFEIASHFRVQYFFVLLSSGIIFLLGNRKKSAALSGVFAVVNVSLIVPLYFAGSFAHGSSQTLRALFINMNYSNRALNGARKFIRSADPDLIVLVEVNHAWTNALREMGDDYPFSRRLPSRNDRSGVALLSRIPIANSEVGHFGEARLPAVVARFEIDGKPLTVIGTHALTPWGRVRSAYRNQHLSALAQIVNSERGPVMVLADLNTTSWSPFFEDLLRMTGLRDSRRGFGLQSTWPTGFPPLWVTIDHCLVSSRVVVRNRTIGPHVGSDHYPVIVDFSVQPG